MPCRSSPEGTGVDSTVREDILKLSAEHIEVTAFSSVAESYAASLIQPVCYHRLCEAKQKRVEQRFVTMCLLTGSVRETLTFLWRHYPDVCFAMPLDALERIVYIDPVSRQWRCCRAKCLASSGSDHSFVPAEVLGLRR
jgi:hypothetical protein